MFGLLKLAPKIGKIAPAAVEALSASAARVGSVLSKSAPKAVGAVDDVAVGTAKVTARAGDEAFVATAKLSESAGKAGFSKATAGAVSEGRNGMSLSDKWVLRHGKIMGLTALGGGALFGAEYFSGGALSRATPSVITGVAEAIEDISPELAQAVKEKGLSAIATASDISDTEKAAAVNIGSGVLEGKGQHKMAAAMRIGSVVTGASFYLDVANHDEGERAEAALSHLEENADVSREQIIEYLKESPTQRALTEEAFHIDFAEILPELSEVNQSANNTSAQRAAASGVPVTASSATSATASAFGGAAAVAPVVAERALDPDGLALDSDMDWLKFSDVEGGASTSTFLGSIMSGLSWAWNMLVRAWDFFTDLFDGDQIGQGNLQHAGALVPGMTQFKPQGNAPELEPGL